MAIRKLRFKVKDGIDIVAPSGLPPIVTDSTVLNENLNADLLDGQHGTYYATDSLVVHKAGTETITGSKTFQSQSASQTILTVQGALDQDETPYFKIETSDNQNVLTVHNDLIAAYRSVNILPKTSSDVVLTINGKPSQTANLTEWKDSDGNVVAKVDPTGHITANKLTTESDVVVGGNLTVQGTTTTINSIISSVDDPVFLLGGDTAPTEQDFKDRGIEFRWHDGTSAKVGFFGFDDSTERFNFITDATNNGEIFSGTTAGFSADHIQFNLQREVYPIQEGQIFWDDFDGTLGLAVERNDPIGFSNVSAVNQQLIIKVYNNSGSSLSIGDIVSVDGVETVDKRISVVKSIATPNTLPSSILGMVYESIDAGDVGYVVSFGKIYSANTYIDGTSEGAEIWLSDTNSGEWTTIKPSAPNKSIRLGYILKEDASSGIIFLDPKISEGALQYLHDVEFGTLADWDILRYDQTTDTWTNTDISTVINALETINAQNIIISGNLTVDTNAWIKGDLDVDGDINFDGGDITTSATTVNLVNGTATDIFFGGAATNIQIGSSSGTTNINHDLDVDGDINIDGGDLTVTGQTFNLANDTVTTVNFAGAATDIQIGSSLGTTNINNDLKVDGDEISTDSVSFTLLDTPTSIEFATSATSLEIGASTGTTNVNNNLDVDGDVNIDGGDLTVSTSTFNLANTTATTVNFAGAATDVQIGSSTGTTNVNNNLDVDGDVNVDGGDLTSNVSSFNLLNTTVESINFGGAATTIEIGSSTGTTNVNNNLDVDGDVSIDGGDLNATTSSFNLLNFPTSINFGTSATDVQIGAATGITNVNNNLDVDGDVNVDGGDITTNLTSFNLLNTNAATINFAGEATVLSIGADTGTTTVNNNLTVKDILTIEGTTTNFNPPVVSPPFTLGTNAIDQLIEGLNADLLDGQEGTWYQDRQNHTGQQDHTTISDWEEAVEDEVAPMFVHSQHLGVVATYNDVTGRILLQVTGSESGVGTNFPINYWMGV